MTPYETLEIHPGASQAEIQAAYRRLVRKWHPDRNHGSQAAAREFCKVQAAYDSIMSGAAARAHFGDTRAHAEKPREEPRQERREKPKPEPEPEPQTESEPRYTYAEWRAVFDESLRQAEAEAVERVNEHLAQQWRDAEQREFQARHPNLYRKPIIPPDHWLSTELGWKFWPLAFAAGILISAVVGLIIHH